MVTVTKNGRRNSYRIHVKKTLRHDLESACTLKDLIKFVNKDSRSRQSSAADKDESKKSMSRKVKSQVTEKVPAPPLVARKKSIQDPVAELEKEKPEPTQAETERQQGLLF